MNFIPITLLSLLVLSPVFAAPTSENDPFRAIALHVQRRPEPPICCLKPLVPLETVDDDVLLSFEEWKAKQSTLLLQTEAKAKQKADANRSENGAANGGNAGGQGNGSDTALLSSADTTSSQSGSQSRSEELTPEQPHESVSPHFRVPLTDRFNYANTECSARVHLAHRSAKSPSAILSHKRDRYMLSPCDSSKENQFVIVELCEDIRIDTVQLANFEFFSGVFKDFTVSVAKTDIMDPDDRTFAGTYTAKNVRGVQSFHPPSSLRDFYRFIRIDFHSHYGSEYYCPVSLLRVYGLTHMEHWKWDVWEAESRAKAAETEKYSSSVAEVLETTDLPYSATAPDNAKEIFYPNEPDIDLQLMSSPSKLPSSVEEQFTPPATSIDDSQQTSTPLPKTSLPESDRLQANYSGPHISPSTTLQSKSKSPESTAPINHLTDFLVSPPLSSTHTPTSIPETTPSSPHADTPTIAKAATNATHKGKSASSVSLAVSITPSVASIHTVVHVNAASSTTPPGAIPTISSLISIPLPPPPLPGGESIYRTIMNRLAALEANHTLYTQYIEQQNSVIRDVIKRLGEELGRLEGIGRAQSQMHQRSSQDWEKQRRQILTDFVELRSRVEYLTDEIILEKRLGVAQLCLLLAVLIFMGLTRGSRGEPHIRHTRAVTQSMREWGRRHLSFSGDWTSRFKGENKIKTVSNSVSPERNSIERTQMPPPLQLLPNQGDQVEFPLLDTRKTRPLEPIELNTASSSIPNGKLNLPRTRNRTISNSRSHTPQSRKVYLTLMQPRPITPTRSTFAYGYVHRPPAILQRSNSQGAGHGGTWSSGGAANGPRSARKWARTAHLHEVRNVHVPRSLSKASRKEGPFSKERSSVGRRRGSRDENDDVFISEPLRRSLTASDYGKPTGGVEDPVDTQTIIGVEKLDIPVAETDPWVDTDSLDDSDVE